MNKEQIKQYYERIEKLLSGSNKKTYGFSPEEIRQILKWYEVLQQRINKAIKYINNFKVTHNIDGDIAYIDEFHILASPKALLEILKGEVDSND